MLRTEEIGDSYIMNYRYDLNGTLVAVSRSNLTDGSSSILFAQTNTRGDVVSLYNSSGVVKVNYVYDSWGKLISATDGSGNALAENSVGDLNSIRYRGYVYDSETGLYYLQSRYYDPEVCRFINSDDMNYLGMSGSVLSYNAFAYCENNAINSSDYSGHVSLSYFSRTWMTKLLLKVVGYEITNRKEIDTIEGFGIKIALTQVATYTANPKAFFTLSKSSVSASLGGLSFSLSNTSFSTESDFSYLGASIKSFVAISKTYVEFGMLVSQYVEGRYKNCSFGIELAVSVKRSVIRTMAVTIVAANLLIPQLTPLFAKGAVVISNLVATASINVKSLLMPVIFATYKSFCR